MQSLTRAKTKYKQNQLSLKYFWERENQLLHVKNSNAKQQKWKSVWKSIVWFSLPVVQLLT